MGGKPASTAEHLPYSMREVARDQIEVVKQLGYSRFSVAGHDHMLDSWSAAPDAFPTHVRAAYVDHFSDLETVHAVCERYRAAATLDYQHDEQDRGSRTISCPVLVLWSQSGPVESFFEPLRVWSQWAEDVRGGPVEGGHFLPEEAPEDVIREFRRFFEARGDR